MNNNVSHIGLLATGDELTHGDTLNTTTQAIATHLSHAGFSLGMHLICGDKEHELINSLQFLSQTHDVLIVTGGLGPTSDDRTRFALAHFLNTSLIPYPQALTHIEQRLNSRGLTMTPNDHQQALFPADAQLFPNPYGTAMGCGYWAAQPGIILLPGPPRECLPMFSDHAFPLLKQHAQPSQKRLLTWKLYNVVEAQIANQLERVLQGVTCSTGYRLDTGYLEFKVRCTPDKIADIQARIDPIAACYAPKK